jgi:IclR family acetate operon transcriptional repressor
VRNASTVTPVPQKKNLTPPIQSLDRGLVILEAVAKSRRPVSTAELAGLLGIDHSSAFRLSTTLKRRGFLACPSGRTEYILGPAIWRLSRQYDWSNMLVSVCHGDLKALADQTGETAHLAVREGQHALFADHATSNHVIVISGQTGEAIPLHCTAHGKALLADFDKPQLEALFGDAPLRAGADSTIVPLDRLAETCAQIRAIGFATDTEEYQAGICCVAAPIRDKDGSVIASIGISAPSTRFPEQRYRTCGAQASKVAQHVRDILRGKV